LTAIPGYYAYYRVGIDLHTGSEFEFDGDSGTWVLLRLLEVAVPY
jgi:hypothetical protein